ncbi:TM2 domain-containing protein [Flammeovirga aprica]|uniref:NINE protein n=1 Tax=Flammeovirga aprica JL-4 TaxID=694437 RepID=A0A7X9XA83_9BACT|nr:NINE protein [Flammeovirga aprica]NME69417.1 NINE protein [Flammeovirga aprica JL-4]
MKSSLVAYILWAFFGVLGIHRFYLGKSFSGILYLLTGGFFLVGWMIDLFLVGGMVDDANFKAGNIAAMERMMYEKY